MVVKFTKYDFLDAICLSPKVIIRKGDEIPFVEMANVATGNRKEPMAIEMRKFSGGTKFEKGDTVVASIEPCLQHGKSFYFTEHDRGAGSTEYLVFRGTEDITTNEFVHYFMMSYEIRAAMIRSMKGATGRQRVDPEVFTGMKMELPDIPTQKKIAAVLSDYDAAIANCRKQIALLEEAAMRLYREWFADGKGENWHAETAFDFCDIMSGGTPSTKHSEYYEGEIPFFTPADGHNVSCVLDTEKHLSSVGVSHCNSQLFPVGTIMVTARGTVGNVVYNAVPMAMNQSCYAIKPKDCCFSPLLLFVMLRNEMRQIQKAGSSGVFDAIKVETFKLLKLKVPNAELASRCLESFQPMYAQVEKLSRQICSLTEARDRLLPKLMKGELEV